MSELSVKEWYNEFSEVLPAPHIIFMNYGYHSGESANFDWIKEQDLYHRNSISLINHIVKDVDFSGKKVLEVGSGKGGNCYYLSQYTNADEVVGMDICKSHVAFSKETHQFENLSFQQGDAEALPFDDESFDIVINIESSHSYPDINKFFSEVSRVLKKGGVFCYTDLMLNTENHEALSKEIPNFQYYKPEQAHLEVIESSGLAIDRYENITADVQRSLECSEGNLKSLTHELRSQHESTDLSEQTRMELDMIAGSFDVAVKAFSSGDLLYQCWTLQKR